MPDLTITQFLSLDGVCQAPGGPDEDTSGGFSHGGWIWPFTDEMSSAMILGNFQKPAAFLLGRKTYEIFAGYWPKVTDPNNLIATKFNTLPKFVASRTIQPAAAAWNETTIVRDVLAEVSAIKKNLAANSGAGVGGGELQVHGSSLLAQTLLNHGLVDELRLLTFPVILGGGKRFFGARDGGVSPGTLKLVSSKATSKGVVIDIYRPAGPLVTRRIDE